MELIYTRRFSWSAAFWGCGAVAFAIAGGIFHNLHFAIFALAPALLALGLFFGRPRNFHGRLTDNGIEVDQPNELNIPYDEIEGLAINGFSFDPSESNNIRRGTLAVTNRKNILLIPVVLNVPSFKVYQTIFAMLPTTGSYQLSEPFSDHVRKETETFGKDRVHAFSKRTVFGALRSTRRGRICAGMLLLCGILWFSAGLTMFAPNDFDNQTVWVAAGALLLFGSIIAWVVFHNAQKSNVRLAKHCKESELVVSPTGIAVSQGDIQGHLRWEELQDVRFAKRPRVFTLTGYSSVGNVELRIAGAKIYLADIYDRPMALIHQLIRRYWKGE